MAEQQKILITTRSFRRMEGPHQKILLDAGYEVVNSPYSRAATSAEMVEIFQTTDNLIGAILGLDELDAPAIAAAKAAGVKVFSRFGVGVDAIDLQAATEHAIPVTITPGANSIAVAELALTLMLSLARRVPEQNQSTKAGAWSSLTGMELYGGTLGLVGLGRIGQEVVKRATAFGMKIIFHDPAPPDEGFIRQHNCQNVSLEELFAQSDFISLHAPLIDVTRHMVNGETLKLFKPTAYLINTARGGLVDEAALYEALAAGQLAGAGFDVFEQEPPGASPLLTLDNFIATPHAASATRQTTLRMGLMASENALAVLRGEQPESTVNPAAYEQQQ